MKPNIQHFHVIRVKLSSSPQWSRALLMNIVSEIAHCDIEKERKKERDIFVQGLGLVKYVWTTLLNVMKGRACIKV